MAYIHHRRKYEPFRVRQNLDHCLNLNPFWDLSIIILKSCLNLLCLFRPYTDYSNKILSGHGWPSKLKHSRQTTSSVISSIGPLWQSMRFGCSLQCITIYELGAVLAHRMDDNSEKPIAYTSRTLIKAELHYSQIENEGLAIIFAGKKFHRYLYGRAFTLHSDQQSLKYLLNESGQVPVMASCRNQRWAMTLGAGVYHPTPAWEENG